MARQILTLPPYTRPRVNRGANRGTINRTGSAASESQLTVSGFGTKIRTIYGRVSVGAVTPTYVKHPDGSLLILCIFASNPCRSIEKLYVGGEIWGGEKHIYLGNQTEPDEWLEDAIGSKYKDVLPGYTYAVVKIRDKGEDTPDFGNIRAIVQGWQTNYYKNPASAMAHFAITYMGLAVEPTGLAEAEAYCLEIIGGQRRREFGLAMENVAFKTEWLATLSEYAGCYYYIRAKTLHMIVKKPRSVSHNLTSDHIIAESVKTWRSPLQEVPNRIITSYTVPVNNDKAWETNKVFTEHANIPLDRLRESSLTMPGWQSASCAKRWSIERLNEKTLCDLGLEFAAPAVVAKNIKVGEVISVTSIIGLSNKQFTVLKCDPQDANRSLITAVEYDEAVFSNAIETTPTTPDTNLPLPTDVNPITGLRVSEVIKQDNTGIWRSYLVVAFDRDISHYRYDCEVYNVNDMSKSVYQDAGFPLTEFTTSALPESKTYQVKVRATNRFGREGQWATTEIFTDGKTIPPTDIEQIEGFENGGIVFLNWTASTDMDLKDYVVHWMPQGHPWNGPFAKKADEVKSLNTQIYRIPGGRWDFCVKARDHAFNLSVNEARVTVEVDEEAALQGDEHIFQNFTLTNMVKQYNGFFDDWRKERYITSVNEPIASVLTGALSQYTEPLATYHSPVTSRIETEVHDYTKGISGNWYGYMNTTPIDVPNTELMRLSTDGVNFNDEPLRFKGTAQYVQQAAETTGTQSAENPMWRVSAIAKERQEKFSIKQSEMTAGQPFVINLQGYYYDLVDITLKTEGRNIIVYENVVLSLDENVQNSFEVYIYDNLNNLIAADFTAIFTGR